MKRTVLRTPYVAAALFDIQIRYAVAVSLLTEKEQLNLITLLRKDLEQRQRVIEARRAKRSA